MSVIVEGLINGIDLCYIQDLGTPIDARAIKDAGFEFAYVKSSQYSSTPDLRFPSMVERLPAAGLKVGAYHFCSHDTDPVSQAEFFFKASRGLGKNAGELPPMLDWEFCTPSKYNPHPFHCVDWLEQCAKKVTEVWYPDNEQRINKRLPVLYTYPFYAGAHQPALAASRVLGSYPLCFASYNLSGQVPEASQLPFHAIPKPWSTWTLCQYSGNKGERVPGISGACDRDVFSGNGDDWARFLGYPVNNEGVLV